MRTCYPFPENLLRRLEVNGSCVEFTGARDPLGYGRVYGGNGKTEFAHRAMYTLMVGPVPDGLELDHLCCNPPCCNPAHLEPVTHAENMRRAGNHQPKAKWTHCIHGHEFTPENTYKRPAGGRQCRACGIAATKRYNERKKVA